jgi:hypothetical protein
MPKYWKTRMSVSILSEGDKPPIFDDLKAVHEAITIGDCSGEVECRGCIPLTEEQCAEALMAQGSDPAFLIEGYDGE